MIPRRIRPWAPALGLAALTLLGLDRPARAQKMRGFAADHFEPSVPVDALFGVPSPAVGGHLVPRFAAVFDYAHRPFFVRTEDMRRTAVVAGQGYLRLDASLALWDRILVSIDAPFALLQSGASPPSLQSVDFHPPSSPAVGDLRLGVRARIWGDFHDPFQIGAGGYFYVPTGSPDAYTGDGAVRGNLHLLLGGRFRLGIPWTWSAAGGITMRAHEAPLATFGGGMAFVLGEDRVQIGPEVFGSNQIGGALRSIPDTDITAKSSLVVELLGGIKWRIAGGLFVGAAAGAGLVTNIGSPGFRGVASVGWAPVPPARSGRQKTPLRDRDRDGIADAFDACPDEKGDLQSDPRKDGCPIPDRDHDSIADIDDACPNEPGTRSLVATRNGCPPDGDRDRDGVPDPIDACPDRPGIASTDAKQNGCPDDPDQDGIRGLADACPDDAGAPDPYPKQNGCPRHLRIEGDEIVLRKPIRFQVYGKRRSETVAPLPDEILRELRDVLGAHPEITKIEVQGHTDDSGEDEFNERLSEERARAVIDWLVATGVPPSVLVPRGYGHEKPAADNRTRQGRTKNRRVQIFIVERRK